MTTTHSHHSRRVLDVASLILLIIGIGSGVLSYWLTAQRGFSPLIFIPSVLATVTGLTHLTKREAPRH